MRRLIALAAALYSVPVAHAAAQHQARIVVRIVLAMHEYLAADLHDPGGAFTIVREAAVGDTVTKLADLEAVLGSRARFADSGARIIKCDSEVRSARRHCWYPEDGRVLVIQNITEQPDRVLVLVDIASSGPTGSGVRSIGNKRT